MDNLKKSTFKSHKEQPKLSPRQAKHLQTEFLTKISHKLRTPLNAIIGFSEMICHEKAGAINTEQREYLNDILASAKDLLLLIKSISDFATHNQIKKLNKKPKTFSKPRKTHT